MQNNTVKIIGAGLAGTEAALYLAEKGIKVKLFDIKPKKFTPAHKSEKFAELVCSNSLKSNDVYGNAAGLLKEEMRMLGSSVIAAADSARVPAGNALAVDREKFAEILTAKLYGQKNIEIICEEVDNVNFDEYTVIASGPLTTSPLAEFLKSFVGDGLSFYDASAPIVSSESIDMENAFFGDRYGKGNADHINCPMNKEQYEEFINALTVAERAKAHDFENASVFEGCMPIEIMAQRGKDTLRFGPLKPVGLTDPKTGRWPYACLQLRKEDEKGSMYNLVGFQTNLKQGEQKKVFGIIPALKNADFLRYGVMHRNTFINSPDLLDADYSVKAHPKTYFAGQITGVEGYVESAMSGLMCGIYIERAINGKEKVYISQKTVSGALAAYITTKNKDFQPMNANFGILPTITAIRDKSERKRRYGEISLEEVKKFKEIISND